MLHTSIVFTALISTTDSSVEDCKRTHIPSEFMERACMLEFLSPLSDVNCDAVMHDDRNSPVCGDGGAITPWQGIHCLSMTVMSVFYHESTLGQFNIHFLPSTVQQIYIARSHQEYQIQPRQLPRNLRDLCMPYNKLFGSIDFESFPVKIEEIHLSFNEFCAPICLILPKKLRTLNMRDNPIRQRTVYYDCDPEVLKTVFFMNTKVRRFVPLDPAHVVGDRVFLYTPA